MFVFSSIRLRLLVTSALSIVFVLLMILSQNYFSHQQSSLYKQRVLMMQLAADIIEISAAEKTFVFQSQAADYSHILERIKALRSQLAAGSSHGVQIGLDTERRDELTGLFDQHLLLLDKLHQLKSAIGFTENEGAQGAFRRAIHALEAAFSEDESQQVRLLQLRRAEKDFMLRKRTEYIEKNAQIYQNLRSELVAKSKEFDGLLPLLETYADEFRHLCDLYIELGLDTNHGLQHELSNSSIMITNRFSDVRQELTAKLNDSERKMARYYWFIVFLSSLVLVIISISSYFSIHRALTSFMEFFYHSRRSKSTIKENDLAFSEFRQMAAVANEMIEIRSVIESQLQETKNALLEANEELSNYALMDSLTGIANRRKLDAILEQEIKLCAREGFPISVILIDVDHFKLFNDNYGHVQGDQVLKAIAQSLQESARREADLVARYGGEEFAVVLPNTDEEGALAFVDVALQGIRDLALPHAASPTAEIITASAGVLTMHMEKYVPAEVLFVQVDNALYQAKANGRNGFAISPSVVG